MMQKLLPIFCGDFFEAQEALTSAIGEEIGSWLTVGGFFAGMLLGALIDKLVLNQGNPHKVKKVEEMDQSPPNRPEIRN
ncbi:hypothetical protein [Salicibibacter cibarius]